MNQTTQRPTSTVVASAAATTTTAAESETMTTIQEKLPQPAVQNGVMQSKTTTQQQPPQPQSEAEPQQVRPEETSSSSSSPPQSHESQSQSSFFDDCCYYIYRYLYLGVIATLNIPFWGMILCSLVYIGLWRMATSVWFQTLLLAYLVYAWLDPTPSRGGFSTRLWSNQNIEAMRHVWFLKRFGEYFPATLHKTTDLLPQDGPYLFLYHPHGVIGVGACCTLYCNAANFDTMFPHVPRKSVTLNACFFVPLFREWMLSLGLVSANKATLKHVLKDRQESLVLLPGGATEALYAQQGTMHLYLRRRKGFVKLALETGATLVPVLGFGENDALTAASLDKNSALARLQKWLQKWLSFSLPVLTWPLPRPHPIHVVVGTPVPFHDIVKDKDTTSTTTPHIVDACHEKYVQALTDLYETHKSEYGHQHIALQIH